MATSGPSAAPERSSIRPPAPAEATRNDAVERSSRLYGVNEIQSPSSMNAAAWPPPVSVVASFWTPASPVESVPGTRPVFA